MNYKVAAIMPAYNEVPNYYNPSYLDSVVKALIESKEKGLINKIFVVNDGSTDFTGPRLAKYKPTIELIHHSDRYGYPENRGKLSAVFTGIKAAKEDGADILITVDSDMKNLDYYSINSLLKPLKNPGVDITIADYLQETEMCGYEHSGFRAMRLSVFDPWLSHMHPDYKTWTFILKDLKKHAGDYKNFDFGLRREITLGYSLETFLDQMALLYGLKKEKIPDLGLVSRKIGSGPCTLGEINLGISWAINIFDELSEIGIFKKRNTLFNL